MGAKLEIPNNDDNLIPVGNGMYNLKTKRLVPYNPKTVFTSKVATDYHENLDEPVFNGWSFSKWLNEIAENDTDKITLLWQVVACCVKTPRTADVMFCLIDDNVSRTGKSTFQALMTNLVGESNTGALRIDEFEKRFALARVYDKKN